MREPFCNTFGHGPEPVLALHCSLAHSGAWKGVARQLADQVTVAAMDLPSHGRSPDWNSDDDFADLAVRWAASLLDRPVTLFGHSFGGYVALRLAVEYPQYVKAIALYETVFFAAGRAGNPSLISDYEAEMAEVHDLCEVGQPEEAARLFVRAWGDGRRWFDLPEDMRAGFAQRIPAVLAAQNSILFDSAGILPKLSEIQVPVLLIDGAQSHATMPVVQDGLANLIPNATRMTLAECAHMGPITHPKLVASAFAQLIAEMRAVGESENADFG
jgi:pimeloyl-ACP methyl ester carboxylesterase